MTRLRGQTGTARGVALLATLMVIVIGVGVVASLSADAMTGVEAGRESSANARAMLAARSALERLRVQIGEQREELLAGGTPEFDLGAWSDESMELRLRVLDSESGAVTLAEAGRLPVELVSQGDEVGTLPATAWALLEAAPGEEPGVDLTAFSWEPESSAGVSGDAGTARVRVSDAWTDELEDVLGEVLDGAAVERLRQSFDDDGVPADRTQLIERLDAATIERSAWGEVLDVVRFQQEEFASSRVDLRRAPEAVLSRVPGLNEQLAGAIVSARGSLSEEEAASIAWPVARGLLDASQFGAVARHVTTRSLQWRVIVEVVSVPPEVETTGMAFDAGEPAAGRVLVAMEAVLDAGAERGRLALIRDVTYAPEAWLTTEAVADEDEAESDAVVSGPSLTAGGIDARGFEADRGTTRTSDAPAARGRVSGRVTDNAVDGEAGPQPDDRSAERRAFSRFATPGGAGSGAGGER